MKTIKLITKESKNYYITALNREQKEEIKERYNNNTLLGLSFKIPINLLNIELVGELRKQESIFVSPKITPYLETFEATTAGERQIHYRDYTKSLEKHKEIAWLLNIAPDYRVCWNTIMITLNQACCCVIWWDKEDKIYDYVRTF